MQSCWLSQDYMLCNFLQKGKKKTQAEGRSQKQARVASCIFQFPLTKKKEVLSSQFSNIRRTRFHIYLGDTNFSDSVWFLVPVLGLGTFTVCFLGSWFRVRTFTSSFFGSFSESRTFLCFFHSLFIKVKQLPNDSIFRVYFLIPPMLFPFFGQFLLFFLQEMKVKMRFL